MLFLPSGTFDTEISSFQNHYSVLKGITLQAFVHKKEEVVGKNENLKKERPEFKFYSEFYKATLPSFSITLGLSRVSTSSSK